MTTEAERLGEQLKRDLKMYAQISAREGMDCFTMPSVARSETIAAVDRLVALAQGAQGEPVAYRYKDARGHWRYVGYPFTPGWNMPDGMGHEPLYAHPKETQT